MARITGTARPARVFRLLLLRFFVVLSPRQHRNRHERQNHTDICRTLRLRVSKFITTSILLELHSQAIATELASRLGLVCIIFRFMRHPTSQVSGETVSKKTNAARASHPSRIVCRGNSGCRLSRSESRSRRSAAKSTGSSDHARGLRRSAAGSAFQSCPERQNVFGGPQRPGTSSLDVNWISLRRFPFGNHRHHRTRIGRDSEHSAL